MDGLAAVQARIASIESRIAAMSGRPPLASAPDAGGSFEDALSSALGKSDGAGAAGTARAGLVPAPRLAPGQFGRLQPPAELTRYGNGQIPADALESLGLGNGHRLWSPAAASFRQMAADAAAQGVDIGVTDSYRSYDAQVRLADEKGLYENGGLAARPGTSNHGWGMSLDLDLDDRAQAWMRENGWRYGFAEDVPREPWHWTYRAAV